MGDGLKIKIGIVGTVPAALKRAAGTLRPALVGGMRDLMIDVHRRASLKISGPVVKVRSGHLRRSLGPPTVRATGDRVEGTLGARAKYAKAQEEGTGPYTIRPKRGKALRFLGRGGQPVFVREVQHPGLRPRPFLRPSLQEVREGPPRAAERLRQIVLRTIREAR